MKIIGPLNISFNDIKNQTIINEQINIPLATLESPLWPSVARGAAVSRKIKDGIKISVLSNTMTRSVAFRANSSQDLHNLIAQLPDYMAKMQECVSKTSRFAVLQDYYPEIIGNQLFIRFAFETGDASGHNMATKAAEALMNWFLEEFKDYNLSYVSISGNLCIDKKVSAINSILGRGVHVTAEMHIPGKICEKLLKTTPEKLVELHIRKNLLGSIAAGSLRSANAHVANMLLAFYLATGQDAANIIEGSQAIDHLEVQGDNLYISVTLPNLIVGTIGSGKGLPYVLENLKLLGCLDTRDKAENRVRLASICAASVLCGELSLLAAQTNPGELMAAHMRLERVNQRKSS